MDQKIKGRVVICGPMRNGVQYLSGVRRNMERIGESFDDYRIVIVESDSNDNTPSHLQTWAYENERMEFVSLGPLRNHLPQRTLRLAHARNTVLDIIWEKYGDFDYMVMMDPDDVCFYPIEGFHTCWNSEVGDDWDAMTANQRHEYYDVWALRGNGCDYDCWVKGQLEGLAMGDIMDKYVRPHMKPIPAGPPILVDSAFGGLGVYKMKSIKGCRYVGADTFEGKVFEVADHIAFHQQMREKGCKIYINTRMINNDSLSYPDLSESFIPLLVPKTIKRSGESHLTKIRVGAKNDGGYVIPKELINQCDTLYSYGINNDVSFDEHFLDLRVNPLPIHMYDHTIEKLPKEHDCFIFHKEGIGAKKQHNLDTFENQVRANGDEEKSIILKMDVEGAEWDVLPQILQSPLVKNIICITLEIHWLNDCSMHPRLVDILKALNESFILLHIHGNNYAPTYGKHNIPQVLELTYVARKFATDCTIEDDKELYPTVYDMPNNPYASDHQLTFYRGKCNLGHLDISAWERILFTVKDDANTYLEIGTDETSVLEWMLRNVLVHKDSKTHVLNVDSDPDIFKLTPSVTVIDKLSNSQYRIAYIPSKHHQFINQVYDLVEENGLLILDTCGDIKDMALMALGAASLITKHKEKIATLHSFKQFFIYKI